MDIIQIGLGFLEGIALIFSPCILPILPFMLAGSLEGGKKRPLGIVIGFIFAFALFTFFSRSLVYYSGIDVSLIRHVSYGLLFLFGWIMVSTNLTNKFTQYTQKLMKIDALFSTNQHGFFSGLIFGGLVGLIWTPCGGPILAAAIVQSIVQKTALGSLFIVLAFSLGAAIPMLLIALFGRAILSKMNFLKYHTNIMRKLFGMIIILSVFYMIYEEVYPNSSAQPVVSAVQGTSLLNGLSQSYVAPDFSSTKEWINSSPLHIADLRGKVVLIDFWTYSCINCIRTFPYLKNWYEKYHTKGLEIIGVHTPEFEFEKNFSNVEHAVKAYGISYPVVLDNQFITWQNYQNRYWPAHYLINKKGEVVYQHFGEGEYNITENNIRFLLGLNHTVFNSEVNKVSHERQTPETYLGYFRAQQFAGPGNLLPNKIKHYIFPEILIENKWALQNAWESKAQYIVSVDSYASLKIHFHARKVFAVMGSATGLSIPVKLMLNGKKLGSEKGSDVNQSTLIVNRNRLYEVLVLSRVTSGILQLIALAPGLEIYTFTFGE